MVGTVAGKVHASAGSSTVAPCNAVCWSCRGALPVLLGPLVSAWQPAAESICRFLHFYGWSFSASD